MAVLCTQMMGMTPILPALTTAGVAPAFGTPITFVPPEAPEGQTAPMHNYADFGSLPAVRLNKPYMLMADGGNGAALDRLYAGQSEVEHRVNSILDEVKQGIAGLSTNETGILIATLKGLDSRAREALSIFSEYKNKILAVPQSARKNIRYWDIRSWGHTMLNTIQGVIPRPNHLVRLLEKGASYDEIKTFIEKPFPAVTANKFEMYDSFASEMGVRIRFARGQADLEISGRMPNWFRDIVANLISNTAKCIRPGESAELVIDYDRATGTFSFANNTPPISIATHQKIGREFVHDDPGKEGSGEGLFVEFRQVEAHGGKMWVDRGVDADPTRGIAEKGPTFYIKLPPLGGNIRKHLWPHPNTTDYVGVSAYQIQLAMRYAELKSLDENAQKELAGHLAEFAVLLTLYNNDVDTMAEDPFVRAMVTTENSFSRFLKCFRRVAGKGDMGSQDFMVYLYVIEGMRQNILPEIIPILFNAENFIPAWLSRQIIITKSYSPMEVMKALDDIISQFYELGEERATVLEQLLYWGIISYHSDRTPAEVSAFAKAIGENLHKVAPDADLKRLISDISEVANQGTPIEERSAMIRVLFN